MGCAAENSRYQLMINGKADQFGRCSQVQFLQNAGAIGADRFDAEGKLIGDLGRRGPRGLVSRTASSPSGCPDDPKSGMPM